MAIYQIKKIEELEKLTGKKTAKNQHKNITKILDTMPVRLTDYLLKLSKKSPAVAMQFFPNIEELKENGCEKPFSGVMKTGIEGLERIYYKKSKKNRTHSGYSHRNAFPDVCSRKNHRRFCKNVTQVSRFQENETDRNRRTLQSS
ncbi:MAG: hypothetical protein Q8P62_01190 [Candidatus Peregrinibacteria bacterium]|nr:hypothetical protein [Candidatus Peregrinibacteria bacterium]